jgi:membrane-associated phospholipid phosphatase
VLRVVKPISRERLILLDKGGRLCEEVSRGKEESMKLSRFLFISSIAQFALLIPLARWARRHGKPLREVVLTRLLQKNQKSWKRTIVTIFNTLTGSSVFLNVLVVPIAAIFWTMRMRREALAILSSCWSGALVRTMLKQVIDRPRPNRALVHVKSQSRGKSFPSGHVASSVCLWGWVCALGFLDKTQSKKRILLGIPAAFAVFTGPARVYLGEHWPTDVLGGYLFGGGWLALSLSLYLQVRDRITETDLVRCTIQ